MILLKNKTIGANRTIPSIYIKISRKSVTFLSYFSKKGFFSNIGQKKSPSKAVGPFCRGVFQVGIGSF
ncbi:hypothetical protein [Fibrobacter sp.]|uniref:hypothetical protein n=1 Tax=Fibrobacter sp. TaxID=35828 RepID=UPI0025C084F9|nr:hypothetical protein [Fibrobacter sp.]MCI6436719.1 hypothetical protein [Fibrobacter sp.]MDD7497348.1 hypothetical protein [Fibrobacter sp.]MDY5725663.1 hypothetical protein [Fibrobacter sp.]